MKAILKNGQPKYQSQYKVWIDLDGNQTSTKGATEQQWMSWGFKDVIEVIATPEQILGDWYETETEITRYVTDKTPEVIADELVQRKANAVLRFEADTDDLIRQVVGERSNEYEIAEQEATAFKAAGYPEFDVPFSVSSDAVANGRTSQEACDLILLMAENWRAVQGILRSKRLMTKAQIKQITVEADADVIITEWDEFINSLRAQILE